MGAAIISILKVESWADSASLGGSPKSPSCSDPGSSWITASVLGLKVKFCVYTLWVKSATYISLGLLNLSPADFKAKHFWGLSPGARFLGWGPQCGSWTLRSLEKTSKIVVFLLFVCHWPRLEGPDCNPKRHLFFSYLLHCAPSLYL